MKKIEVITRSELKNVVVPVINKNPWSIWIC